MHVCQKKHRLSQNELTKSQVTTNDTYLPRNVHSAKTHYLTNHKREIPDKVSVTQDQPLQKMNAGLLTHDTCSDLNPCMQIAATLVGEEGKSVPVMI